MGKLTLEYKKGNEKGEDECSQNLMLKQIIFYERPLAQSVRTEPALCLCHLADLAMASFNRAGRVDQLADLRSVMNKLQVSQKLLLILAGKILEQVAYLVDDAKLYIRLRENSSCKTHQIHHHPSLYGSFFE